MGANWLPNKNMLKTPQKKSDVADLNIFICKLCQTHSNLVSFLDSACAELGVSSLEAQALSQLNRSGGSSVSELQKTLGARRSTLTSVLDRLSERRMIKREISSNDRRSFFVRLTPKGNKTSDKISEVMKRFEKSISSELSARQIQGFQAALEAINRETQATALSACQTPDSK